MLSLKKVYGDELLQIALVLSLLRVDPDSYLGLEPLSLRGMPAGGDWPLEQAQTLIRPRHVQVHHKSLDSVLLSYERHLFEDLNSLGRYQRPGGFDIQAYLLNVQGDSVRHSGDVVPEQTQAESTIEVATPSPPPEININENRTDFIATSYFASEDDLFLHSDLFEHESIIDQNIADLNDYSDIPIPNFNLYGTKDQIEYEKLFSNDETPEVPDIEIKRERASTSFSSDASDLGYLTEAELWQSAVKEEPTVKVKKEPIDEPEDADTVETNPAELTQEEMDLIEVLWKQDVDLGFSLDMSPFSKNTETKQSTISSDETEKLKALQSLKNEGNEDKEDISPALDDPWAGLSYTIDTETGEYVLKPLSEGPSLPLDDFLLEEALQLAGLEAAPDTGDQDLDIATVNVLKSEPDENQTLDSSVLSLSPLTLAESDSNSGLASNLLTDLKTAVEGDDPETTLSSNICSDLVTDDEELNLLCDMIQTAQFHHPRQHHPHDLHAGHGGHPGGHSGHYHAAAAHHHAAAAAHAFHQGRMPLVRTMSMEQRWQDLANLLSLPGPVPVPPHGDHSSLPHSSAHHPHHPSHPHHPLSHPHHSLAPHHPSVGSGATAHHPHPSTHPSTLHHGPSPHHYGHSPFAATPGSGASNYPPPQGYMDRSGVLLHNASLTPPMGDLNAANSSYGGTNLGAAVTSSMHLTNSSETLDSGTGASGGSYKLEGGHDLLYYQNATTELNQTTDGFLNSILNDEDLQLMDMAVNEGMYTMRMLDSAHNNASSNSSVLGAVGGATSLSGTASGGVIGTSAGDRLDASSDSAVSSMGSERVPSLSDGEWGDAGSDSAQDYHQSKYGPYDYSYSGRISSDTASARQAPVAQKKHHMFGKRYFQEQNSSVVVTPPISALLPHPSATVPPSGLPTIKYEYDSHYPTMPHHTPGSLEGAVGPKSAEMKYSCTMDFARQQNTRASMEHISHNHTYHLPQSNGATPRPQARDKKSRRSEEEHLTRDEKRARALNVPILVQDIINLPMDEFNERLSKYDLSEPQLSLIRDIRRRGKNKVAAQNCRKRKLDQIVTLADEVKDMKDRKMRLLRERDQVLTERQRVKDKFAQLYRHVFQNLRDPDGNPYSSYQYSLQQSADGSVVLVPRANQSILDQSGSGSNSSDSQSSSSRNPHNQQRKD